MTEYTTPTQRSWEETCPESITSDVIWKLDAYRATLYLLHLAGEDCAAIGPEKQLVVSQLLRAAGSISANFGEGYGRATRADRIRFMTYALGSVRECSSWYTALSVELGREALDARRVLLARIRALILGVIKSERAKLGRRTFDR